MSARLFVDNLPSLVREKDIEEMFSMYGAVLSVYLAGAWETQSGSTFAFVDMYNAREAEHAVRHIHNSSLGGRTISVMLSREGSRAVHDLPIAC